MVQLVTYPVKGCAGTSLDHGYLGPAGLPHDRSFVVVEAADGKLVTQRTDPVLATVRPAVRHDGAKLGLATPGVEDFVVDVDPDGERRPATVWSWHGRAADQGDEVAAWFSQVLGRAVRLVHAPPGFDRAAPGGGAGTVRFADAYPLLVLSESSLDGLNARLLERGGTALPANRFRPNVVIRGWTEPHVEDSARRLTVGSAEIGFAKQCKRCAVPTIDQETGRKDGPEPTRTLATYRRKLLGVVFGANYLVRAPGQVAVGDPVIVHS